MADDKGEKSGLDRSHIDVNDEYEVRYWCEMFGVAPDDLRRAVGQVGSSVVEVKNYFGR
jgi:hypothetical protein